MKRRTNTPLSQLLTFKPIGSVPEHILVESLSDLRQCIADYDTLTVIGKGSNTLIRVDQLRGPILTLSSKSTPFNQEDDAFSLDGNTIGAGRVGTRRETSRNSVWLGAGMGVHTVMSYSQSIERSGLEFSSGVPATIGGMITMNFGCWGHEIQEFIETVVVMTSTGDIQRLRRDECGFDYRSSRFQSTNDIVLGAYFNLPYKPSAAIKALVHDRIQERLSKQPLREPTFGSIFKNPPGDFAGRLIESAGLKGQSFGEVRLSDQHANFMVHSGRGSVEDAIAAIRQIQDRVLAHSGILLEPEVHYCP